MTGHLMTAAVPGLLTVQEAVFVVALHRYVAERRAYGERVDEALAGKVAAVAAAAGIHPLVNLRLFGFEVANGALVPLTPGAVQWATEQIERLGGALSLQKLWDQLKGRSVAELERMETRRGVR